MWQGEPVRLVSPLWYLAAFLVVLGGWMAATVVAAGTWGLVRDATLVDPTEAVDAGGSSLAVFTDISQPERDVTCTATPADEEAEPLDVPAAPVDLTVARDGGRWYFIGWLAEGRDGLTVRCTPADETPDNAGYRVAVVDGALDPARRGSLITYLATGAGIALAVVTWLSRRRARREA